MNNDDLDTPEDFDKEVVQKPSLKEAWEGSPALKLVAIALAGAVVIGGYVTFFGGAEEGAGVKATVHVGDLSKVKQAPGQEDLDPAYQKALEESNRKIAEQALRTSESALPTPIGTAKGGGLDLPTMPSKPESDVLEEWRKATQLSREKAAKDLIEEEGLGPQADVVPMVRPIRPQQVVKQDPEMAKRLAEQMRVIIAAQAPPAPKRLVITPEDSPYKEMKKEAASKAAADKAAGAPRGLSPPGPGPGAGGKDKGIRTIVPAGSIAYAQLLTELNSDIEGPALAQVLSGPFAGGRMIGEVDVKDEFMIINFTRVIKDAVSYGMNGVALDEKTTLAGQATDVDHHYFMRVVLPAAAKFVEGYGSSVAKTGTTTTQTAGGGQLGEQPKPDAKESIYKGVEESAKTIGKILDKNADRPVTVKIAKGTTMGVFFVETVTTRDVEK